MSTTDIDIAVVGATGAVGEAMLSILAERGFTSGTVHALASERSVGKRVEYGERGRVLLTTLTKEFFMPRFAERDEGERAAPCEKYPWDGVKDLGLLTSLQSSVAVGVY